MEFKAQVFDPVALKTDCLIVAIPAKGELNARRQIVNEATGSLLTACQQEGELAKFLDTVNIYRPAGLAAKRLVLISTGTKAVLTAWEFCRLAGRVASLSRGPGIKSVAVSLEDIEVEGRESSWAAAELAKKITENQYRFEQCKSKKTPPDKLARVVLHASTTDNASLTDSMKRGAAIARGINLARELGDLPANICTPSYLAAEARKLAKGNAKLTVKVLTEAQMKELKMGSLLSVTAGTATPAKMVILEYRGGAKSAKPHVLVGKGVTFDSGGISLKPGAGMDEMKYDMCGAASVLGTFVAATELGLPINLVGIIPAVENMPSGTATKPGDIVTSMSGQTIEVLNTDAEGRLILCDALTYAERYKPRAVVDIATLTGAVVMALGNHVSGLFSNDDDLAAALFEAGESAGDNAWRLPLGEEYDKQLKSNFADMANIGGKGAGSITAACFLGRFTKKYPWAHLDIAGTAWKSGGHKGATGRPVALLVEYLSRQTG